MPRAKKNVGAEQAVEAKSPARKVKREDCKLYLQDEVAEVLPEVVERAKDKVRRGDLTTFKKLWDMSGLDKQMPKERKKHGGLGVRLLNRVKREDGKEARPRSTTGQFVKKAAE